MKTYLFLLSLLVTQSVCQFVFTCVPEDDCNPETGDRPDVVPDPDLCTNFFTCDEEGARSDLSLTCSEGSYFDGEALVPGCYDGSCENSICTAALDCPTSCGEVSNSGLIAFPGECNKYYICESNVFAEGTCTEDGAFFNGVTCATKGEKCCDHMCNGPSCVDIADFTQLPDRTSCDRFFLCLDDVALVQDCPVDQTFDLETNLCSEEATCAIFCTSG